MEIVQMLEFVNKNGNRVHILIELDDQYRIVEVHRSLRSSDNESHTKEVFHADFEYGDDGNVKKLIFKGSIEDDDGATTSLVRANAFTEELLKQ